MTYHGIKVGVDIAGLLPELVLAIALAIPIFEKFGAELVITSAKDGKHGRGSLHYVGLAVDLRVRDLARQDWTLIHEELSLALGQQFDVVLEPDHLHVEFNPKVPV